MQAASLKNKNWRDKKAEKKIADYSQTGKCELLLIVITGDYFKTLRPENIHTVSHRRKSTIK